MIRKSNLNILRIRKNIPSQKTSKWPPPQEAMLKPTSICKDTEFRSRNNAKTFKLQRTITNALRYKSNPSGNVVYLSKHSFPFDTYKLLNKNLNFIHISKRYSKNQLSSDLQNFFRLIKLRAYFKDETCIPKIN